MMTPCIRVFLVDDQPVVLESLENFMKDYPEIQVVGTAGNGQELLRQLASGASEADIILMDINMPVMDGYEATRRVKAAYPSARVLILTMRNRKADLLRAVRNGADGYISKSNSIVEIVEAIRKVWKGEFFVRAGEWQPDE